MKQGFRIYETLLRRFHSSGLFLLAYQFPVWEEWLSWQWCWNIQWLTYRSHLCHLSDSPSQRCWSYWAQTWQWYISGQHSVTYKGIKMLQMKASPKLWNSRKLLYMMIIYQGIHKTPTCCCILYFWQQYYFSGWNTNQRRTAAPREPTARSTEPSLFMSIVPWILRPKYCRPGAKSAAAILWKTERGRNLSKHYNDKHGLQCYDKHIIRAVICAIKLHS